MGKLRNYMAGILFGAASLVSCDNEEIINKKDNQIIQLNEDSEKTFSLEEIITQSKKMQSDEKLVEKYGDFYLCDKDLSKVKNIALVFGADWCPNCRGFQKAFGDLYNEGYKKKEDICFFVYEEIEKDPKAIKFREKMEITSLPSWVVAKRIEKDKFEIIGRGDEETNLDELKRSIDFNLYGIVPKVELRNPAVLVNSLMYGVDLNGYSIEPNKDTICVNFDLTKPEQVELAFRFQYENCGPQNRLLERALKETIENANKGQMCELDKDKEVILDLVKKYPKDFPPKRVAEIIKDVDPKKLQDLVFGMHGQDNPFSTLYDGFHDGAGQDTRKTRFEEDEIKDREKWYGIASRACDFLIPKSFKNTWELYVKDGRAKFDGKAKEYVFLGDSVDETFKKHMEKWANSRENKPSVIYASYPSGSRIDALLANLKVDDRIRAQYRTSIEEFIEREREFYQGMKNNGITLVPNNTPEEVLWSRIKDVKFSVVARYIDYHLSLNYNQAYKRQVYDEIAKFCDDNKERIDRKEVGIFYLEGTSHSLSPFHPLPPDKVGALMAISKYLMYNRNDWPSAIIFENDKGKIKPIATSFTNEKRWLKIPEQ